MSLRKDEKIFVAGHRGMVGSAIHRKLTEDGFTSVLGRSRSELDLLDRGAVQAFFTSEKPSVVVVAAAEHPLASHVASQERAAGESRVAATPETARKFIALGATVAVERG